MSISTLKPVTCRIPPVTGENGSNPDVSKVTLVNRQALPAAVKVQIKSMKEREQPLLQESSTVSTRREMMHLTAVSLCFAYLFFPATAEASLIDTIRQRIREIIGRIKNKDKNKGNEPKDNGAKKSKPTTNEMNGGKVKSKDDVAGKNSGDASQLTPAQASEK